MLRALAKEQVVQIKPRKCTKFSVKFLFVLLKREKETLHSYYIIYKIINHIYYFIYIIIYTTY